MKRAMWTARCKSGYEFGGRPCGRPTPRGVLVCATCQTAMTCYRATATPAATPAAKLAVCAMAVMAVAVAVSMAL